MPDENRAFLGSGWSFPPTFQKAGKKAIVVAEETDIEQSLHILLSTRPGERVMQSRYGCNLDVMLFEPITTRLIAYVKELIKTAILYHEPRIDLKTIAINTDQILEGLVLIELDYTVRSTNSRYNFVYPFYLEESSDSL